MTPRIGHKPKLFMAPCQTSPCTQVQFLTKYKTNFCSNCILSFKVYNNMFGKGGVCCSIVLFVCCVSCVGIVVVV